MSYFEELNKKGEYKKLLEQAELDLSSPEARYWQLTALWRLGEGNRAFALGQQYEKDPICILQ